MGFAGRPLRRGWGLAAIAALSGCTGILQAVFSDETDSVNPGLTTTGGGASASSGQAGGTTTATGGTGGGTSSATGGGVGGEAGATAGTGGAGGSAGPGGGTAGAGGGCPTPLEPGNIPCNAGGNWIDDPDAPNTGTCFQEITADNVNVACPAGFHCRIHCNSGSACSSNTTIDCANQDYRCKVECDGGDACKGSNVYIRCMDARTCELDCGAGGNVCDDAHFVCGSGACGASCATLTPLLDIDETTGSPCDASSTGC